MEELDQALLSPERGLEGDCRGRPGTRQLVILAAEDWAAAQAELGGEVSPWTFRRANLLVSGIVLAREHGGRLRIGEALVELTGECGPCRVMDLQRQGLQEALAPDWRGGRTARVIQGGALRLGDAVEPA